VYVYTAPWTTSNMNVFVESFPIDLHMLVKPATSLVRSANRSFDIKKSYMLNEEESGSILVNVYITLHTLSYLSQSFRIFQEAPRASTLSSLFSRNTRKRSS
jgi:hypothetical protein